MKRPRSPDQAFSCHVARLVVLTMVIVAPAHALGASRVALFVDSFPHTDPIPTVFDRLLDRSLAMEQLIDLDALAPLLSGGADLAQALKPKANIAATDFRFQRQGIDGRLRFLGDPDPFLAYDLKLTNTTDRTVSLSLLLQLPTKTLLPTVSVASQLFGEVLSDSTEAFAILTFEQIILLGFSDGSTLATPFRLSGAGVDGLPIFETISSNPMPTADPVIGIALQTRLTLTPGDTAHLTGHLAAGNFQFPMIAGTDMQLLLQHAVIPEPASAAMLLIGLTAARRRPRISGLRRRSVTMPPACPSTNCSNPST